MGDGGVNPSISFLSTAYRTEDCISQMIESVQAQTRTDWELVVVDNGYSDEMARIVAEYMRDDPRIRLVRQENRGIAGGVNAAAEHARGRYVAVLNSDDQVLPEFVEKLVGRLDAAPDVDVVAPDAFMVLRPSGVALTDTYASDKARMRDRRPLSIEDLFEGFVPYYCAPMRREAWDAVGGLRDLHGYADLQMWLDLTVAGRTIALVEEPLGVWSVDDQSDSRNPESVEILERGREDMIVEAARRSGLSESSEVFARAVRQARHRQAVVRARGRMLAGDAAGARKAARDSLRVAWSVRTVVIAGALFVAPEPLRRAYLLRKRLTPAVARLQGHVRAVRPYSGRRSGGRTDPRDPARSSRD